MGERLRRSLASATIAGVSVFKRQPTTHMHVRTPVMLGVVVLLVILLSAVCYYQVNAPVV